jgi:hypothetical protein
MYKAMYINKSNPSRTPGRPGGRGGVHRVPPLDDLTPRSQNLHRKLLLTLREKRPPRDAAAIEQLKVALEAAQKETNYEAVWVIAEQPCKETGLRFGNLLLITVGQGLALLKDNVLTVELIKTGKARRKRCRKTVSYSSSSFLLNRFNLALHPQSLRDCACQTER